MLLRRIVIAIIILLGLLSLRGYMSGGAPSASGSEQAKTVAIAPGPFSYRPAGDYSRGNRPVDAPLREVRFGKPVIVMKHPVSEADYQRCVAAEACKPLSQPNPARTDYPVTGTSWEDATDYARWLSRETGDAWRLPTDEEWAYIAGSKFKDDALFLGEDADFAQRWIARYEQESARKSEGDQSPRPIGSFGDNEHGVTDLAGNVWEWTDTCYIRQNLGENGQQPNDPFLICGVRVAAGQHRAYISDFTRDARGGGCAAGIPPSNLGFRLIRDDNPSLWQRLRQRLGRG